jgi:hypothetical protein
MCKSHPNVLYALNALGTSIYRSDDTGETWHLYTSKSWYAYPSGAVASADIVFDVDPVDCNKIYTFYQSGDIASYDGHNWKAFGLLSYIRNLPENMDLIKRHPHTGYPGISAIIVDPKNNSVIYATVAQSGVSPVYRSIDGGNTWKDISYNLPRANYGSAMSINPHSGEIFVSSGSGTWVFPPPYQSDALIYNNSSKP